MDVNCAQFDFLVVRPHRFEQLLTREDALRIFEEMAAGDIRRPSEPRGRRADRWATRTSRAGCCDFRSSWADTACSAWARAPAPWAEGLSRIGGAVSRPRRGRLPRARGQHHHGRLAVPAAAQTATNFDPLTPRHPGENPKSADLVDRISACRNGGVDGKPSRGMVLPARHARRLAAAAAWCRSRTVRSGSCAAALRSVMCSRSRHKIPFPRCSWRGRQRARGSWRRTASAPRGRCCADFPSCG